MINFILGAPATAALYTFRPSLAALPSQWLRAAWRWLNTRQES